MIQCWVFVVICVGIAVLGYRLAQPNSRIRAAKSARADDRNRRRVLAITALTKDNARRLDAECDQIHIEEVRKVLRE